ncbi:MAG: CHAT domain-containing protein [Saprospiraceae bacterium]|nr:CHAT domain-containing protein [Saprospiraceae bacterium]
MISKSEYYLGRNLYSTDHKRAYQVSASAFSLRNQIEDDDPELTLKCGYNAAFYADLLKMPDSAKHYLNEVVSSDIINRTTVLARKDLGQLHAENGNFSLAKDYLDQAIQYLAHFNPQQVFDLYLDQSMILLEEAKVVSKDKHESIAQQIINTAVQVLDTTDLSGISRFSLVGYYQNVGWAHRLIFDYPNAVLFTEKALSLTNDPIVETDLNNNLGIYYKHLEQYGKSFKHLKIAEERALSLSEKLKAVQVYDNFGETYLENSQFENAIEYFNKGICTLLSNAEKCSDLHLGEIDAISTLPSMERIWMLTLLDDKAKCYYQWYQKHQDPKNLDLALSYYTLADNVVSLIQKSIPQESGKLLWRSRAKDLYESGVIAAHEAGSMERVHRFIERSKALVLYQAIQLSNATDLLDEEYQKEISSTLLDINNLQSELFDIKDKSTPEALAIKDSILGLESHYSILIDEVSKANPAYYQLNFNDDNIKLHTVQDQLQDDQSLISFFSTETELVGINVSNQNIEFKSLGVIDQIDSLVSDYMKSLNHFDQLGSISDREYQSYLQSFSNSSNELYQVLLKPWNNLNEKIIIIPSENLSDISFEGLIMESPDLSSPMQDWVYVIKEHGVSYSPSMTIWNELQHKQSQGRELMTFTPGFSGSTYVSLDETQSELKDDISHMKVTNYDNSEANLEQLLAYNGEAIINLATHAVINTTESEFSFLLLNDESGKLDTIFLKDIYHIDIPGAFIVVNACETSRGEHSRGEGIISLERAFTYAGASGLITSLWPINDHASSIIMKHFYEKMGDGLEKDEALRLAKLNYLSEVKTEVEAHPFLWAPLIQIGNTNPLEVNALSSHLLWYGLGFILIAIAMYFTIKKSKNK